MNDIYLIVSILLALPIGALGMYWAISFYIRELEEFSSWTIEKAREHQKRIRELEAEIAILKSRKN